MDKLCEAINFMEPDLYTLHVREGRNDFAAWVERTFGEADLGIQMRLHPTPLRMMVAIEKFLRVLDEESRDPEARRN